MTTRNLTRRATASIPGTAVHPSVSSLEPVRRFEVGDKVPVSGDYLAHHGNGGPAQQVSLVEGTMFPGCEICEESVVFDLLAANPAVGVRSSRIMVHRLPHPESDSNETPQRTEPVASNIVRSRTPTHVERITLGEYYADIIRDRHDPTIWIYVVQRTGSPDVLAMGTCTSKQMAFELASGAIRHLASPSSDKAAAS